MSCYSETPSLILPSGYRKSHQSILPYFSHTHHRSHSCHPTCRPKLSPTMPKLKQLSCAIEWAPAGTCLPEYGRVYGDGIVETFIAVPERPQAFDIHLTSTGLISEGLAVLVFIDGQYQCNRNRTNLGSCRSGDVLDSSRVDIRLRQKERPIGDGTYLGREWRFDSHNIGRLLADAKAHVI